MKVAFISTIFWFGIALSQVIEPRQKVEPRQNSGCASVPNFMNSNRIVGGDTASSPIPWQVSIRQGTGANGHFCGGTILDSKTVLSAAHCFDSIGQSMSGYYVTAGLVNKFDTSGQTIAVSYGIWNNNMPYTGENTYNNDFVILKLQSPLSFNQNVEPTCLPSTSTYAPENLGKSCFVSGWGQLQHEGAFPDNLQWVQVPLVTNAQCFQNYNGYIGITSSMICAGYPEGGKDSCQGDSGGPLICNEGGKAVLTGVVSVGLGCAAPNFPGIYARVTAVLSWIENNMESQTSGGCGSPQWANDQFCDDENNNAGCNFDGGACCYNTLSDWNYYCNSCQCFNPTTTTTTPTTTVQNNGNCGSPQWANDNYCDDENNNAGCNFDGGACCNANIAGWGNYCTDCECKEGQNCFAIGIWSGNSNVDEWCNFNCNHVTPFCPETWCSCN